MATAWRASEWRRVCKPLQTEAGESWPSLSYLHSVMYVMIQGDGGGGPGVVDLGVERKSVYVSCSRVVCLRLKGSLVSSLHSFDM